jgi:hypothetical protein
MDFFKTFTDHWGGVYIGIQYKKPIPIEKEIR